MDYIQALHVITDPTRYQILHLLMERHYCVRAVSKKLGISEPAVSQQMNILKKTGIITGSKIGYHMHYVVNLDVAAQIFRQFSEEFHLSAPENFMTTECICEYECERKKELPER
ncbi:metalloregulator ArsR/SmtB family transcription factor [Clostridium sp. HBUAS56010]|uniref:ArsR/SmtB family transcription factor n=1 Tax=Clostridium sp. HBUAS56010 TaxID=2571127 RepID=UPI00117737AC|nr:metalloregulator ArsR/SmtB family transcription factor [Clostridium sp. HBUAS56010]